MCDDEFRAGSRGGFFSGDCSFLPLATHLFGNGQSVRSFTFSFHVITEEHNLQVNLSEVETFGLVYLYY